MNCLLTVTTLLVSSYSQPDDVSSDISQDYPYIEGLLDYLPGYLYGYNSVGSRQGVLSSSDLYTKDNMGINLRGTQRYPLPCQIMWNTIKDFDYFESSDPIWQNTKHFGGPNNQVGDIVYLQDANGFEMYEEIKVLDDNNYLVMGDCNPLSETHQTTGLNKCYWSIKLYNDIHVDYDTYELDNNECLLVVDYDFDIDNNIPNDQRGDVYKDGKGLINFYMGFFLDAALSKFGSNLETSVASINVPSKWIYNYISNLENIDYYLSVFDSNNNVLNVYDGKGILLNPDVRYYPFITLNGEKINEVSRLSKKDDNNYLVVFEIVNPRERGYLYIRYSIECISISDYETEINFVLQFYSMDETEKDSLEEYWEEVFNNMQQNWPDLFDKLYLEESQSA